MNRSIDYTKTHRHLLVADGTGISPSEQRVMQLHYHSPPGTEGQRLHNLVTPRPGYPALLLSSSLTTLRNVSSNCSASWDTYSRKASLIIV